MKKLFLFFLISVSMLSGCAKAPDKITRRSFVFDTVITITADKKDSKHIDTALKICSDYEQVFSRTLPQSELYRINESGIGELSDDMKKIIEFSTTFSKMTDGAFDITVEPLVSLWNIKNRNTPPSKEEISEVLKKVGYEKISFEPFLLNGTTLDLGAITKGYVADRLYEYFKKQGSDNLIIDLGGNVMLIGEFTVGIRDPFSPEEVFATFTLKDKSAVTSGAYQRFFEHDGKVYHHIIDPRTGYPSDSGIASVTIISPSSMQADALSTAIFILGEDAISLCNEFPDTDALIITDDKRIVTTENFNEKYKLQLSE